jgi:hypothetical protein
LIAFLYALEAYRNSNAKPYFCARRQAFLLVWFRLPKAVSFWEKLDKGSNRLNNHNE